MNGESSLQGGTDSPASSDSPAATPTTPSAVARPPEGGAGAAAAAAGTDEHPEGRHPCVGQQGGGCGKVELIQGSQGPYRCLQVLTKLNLPSQALQVLTFASWSLQV